MKSKPMYEHIIQQTRTERSSKINQYKHIPIQWSFRLTNQNAHQIVYGEKSDTNEAFKRLQCELFICCNSIIYLNKCFQVI